MYPCDFYALDQWKLGNISADSLKRMLFGDKKRAFLEESPPIPDECRVCRWYGPCCNGCRRERSPDTGLNRWCSVHAAFLEYAGPRMVEMTGQWQRKSL